MILDSKYDFLKPFIVEKLVRLGRKFDGGYLVCDTALKEIDSLVTFGVGDDISFEMDLENMSKTLKMSKEEIQRIVKEVDYAENG